MQGTDRLDHPPALELANLEAGDVAVCGSSAGRGPLLPDTDDERVAFAAPLDSRSDLEWLLRSLLGHPNVRHLVLCGDDPKATGEALLALWRAGLDANGRVPGSRGRLSPELDAETVDSLRGCVSLSDCRERTLAEIVHHISELPPMAAEAELRSLPRPAVPKRKVFLSRKTTFPMYSTDVGDAWLQLLNLALRIGTEKKTSAGERMAEALNAIVTIDPAAGEEDFPNFFDFNRDDLDRYCRRFESHGSEPERPGARGARPDDSKGIDPFDAVCARLHRSSDERSDTLLFLEPRDLAAADGASGLVSATFDVVEGKLFGSFVHRCADVYTDWPLEAMALVRLQRSLAGRLGLEVGAATFVTHSAQLYARDWDRTARVLAESFKRPLPLQVDPSGIFLFGNDGGEARAMLLDHDASTIFWEEAFSNPEDLSWYIVDVMPWLLPQHVRYVGQECAALMRAIREGECYLQG